MPIRVGGMAIINVPVAPIIDKTCAWRMVLIDRIRWKYVCHGIDANVCKRQTLFLKFYTESEEIRWPTFSLAGVSSQFHALSKQPSYCYSAPDEVKHCN